MLSNVVIPLQAFLPADYADAKGIDCSASTGDVAVFPIPFKCQVFLAGALITETPVGGTSTPVVAFDKRVTAGSDTSRTAATIANLALSTTAAGTLMYDLVAVGESAGVLEPGEEVVVQLVTAAVGTGAAGHFWPILLVKYWPETIANMTGMTATA
jgi:hypothetical protein